MFIVRKWLVRMILCSVNRFDESELLAKKTSGAKRILDTTPGVIVFMVRCSGSAGPSDVVPRVAWYPELDVPLRTFWRRAPAGNRTWLTNFEFHAHPLKL